MWWLGSTQESDEEGYRDDSTDEPPIKKKKLDPLDQYQASNYLPVLSEEEKEAAENALAISKDSNVQIDLDDLFSKTYLLQRHYVSSSLKDQFEKFIWPSKVSWTLYALHLL